MVLKARSNLSISTREASKAHDEHSIDAVSPALFDKFWDLYWTTPLCASPHTRNDLTNMMIGLAGGLSLTETLRISELQKPTVHRPKNSAPTPDDYEIDIPSCAGSHFGYVACRQEFC